MKTRMIVGGFTALALMAAPVLAQTNMPTNEPGTGGVSKPGVSGLPGGKSGPNDRSTMPTTDPTVPPSGGSSVEPKGSKVSPLPAPDSTTLKGQERGTSAGSSSSQDESHVPGAPGGESGTLKK